MRILVLSDIHANWTALSAIKETFDVCLFLGDVVDYGPDPVECLNWVREHASAAIRGNHDHAVAQRVAPRDGPGFRRLIAATRPLAWQHLDNGQLKFLARLPVTRHLTLNGTTFFLVHATPRDPMDEYLSRDPDGWRRQLAEVHADYVCVGHTHHQFHIDLGRTQVLNPGSVGQPRDGDPRAAYAVIDNGRIELKRVEYDFGEVVRRLRSAGVEEALININDHVLRTGGALPFQADRKLNVEQ